MSLMELAQRYNEQFTFNKETARNYDVIARLFSKASGLGCIEGITSEHVVRWRNDTLSRLSVHSYNTYLRHLRILFQHAVESGLIKNNPFRQIHYVNRTTKSRSIAFDNITCVIDWLEQTQEKNQGWFWAILIRFLLNTGMRRRQLVALQWGHIDFERGTILLVQEGSKNSHEWMIPMTDSTISDLLVLRKKTLSVRNPIQLDQQVFCLPLFNHRLKNRKSLTANQVTSFFNKITSKTRITISAHRLRHTLGTKLGTSETPDLMAIQELLGHKNISSTRRYVNSNVGHLRRVLNRDGFEDELSAYQKDFTEST